MKYIGESRVTLTYEMPLAEVVTDFFDEMKSKSKGYAPNVHNPYSLTNAMLLFEVLVGQHSQCSWQLRPNAERSSPGQILDG